MNETVGHTSVLADNATREAEDWQRRAYNIVSYISANFPVGHYVRDSVLDLINDKERTEEQRRNDSNTLWTKFRDDRDYCVRLRDKSDIAPEIAKFLKDYGAWPPPHTRPEDIE